MEPPNGKLPIRAMVDRPMLEIIGNDGRVYITAAKPDQGDVNIVKAFADAGRGGGRKTFVGNSQGRYGNSL